MLQKQSTQVSCYKHNLGCFYYLNGLEVTLNNESLCSKHISLFMYILSLAKCHLNTLCMLIEAIRLKPRITDLDNLNSLCVVYHSSCIHTGLPSHPQHSLANRECKGYGGMVSFRIKGGLEQAQKFMRALKVSHLLTYSSVCSLSKN